MGIGRYYSVASEYGDLLNFNCAVRSLLLRAGLVSLLLFIGALIISLLSSISNFSLIVLLVATTFYLSSCSDAINQMQIAARQRLFVALNRSVDTWLKIALAILFISILGSSSESVLIGYFFCSILVVLCQIYLFKLPNKYNQLEYNLKQSKKWQKDIWNFSCPSLHGEYLPGFINQATDGSSTFL